MPKNIMEKENKDLTILVVDDSEPILNLISTVLRRHEYNLVTAKDGMEAFHKIEEKLPDLILLDIMMPVIDGYEVCRRLKDNEVTRDIPIIFLTAKTSKQDVVQGLEIGGVDYIPKPFDQNEVLARIRTHLELKEAREMILRQNIEMQNLIEDLRLSKEMVEEQAHEMIVLNEKLEEANAILKEMKNQD